MALSVHKDGISFVFIDPMSDIDWATQESCWRGGEVKARWAEAGEPIIKRDGTTAEAKSGEIAILQANGSVAYALPLAIAGKSYNIDALPPKESLSQEVVTLTRKPEQVRVWTASEPTAFESVFPEDRDDQGRGKIRFVQPGEFIEKLPDGRPNPIIPVTADEIGKRYISAEQAAIDLAKFVAPGRGAA